MPLNDLLLSLGVPQASRYTIHEVAYILGLTEDQVRIQIRKGRLVALKGSAHRFVGVLHADLEVYLVSINGGVQ